MLTDLRVEASRYGLSMHPENTQILTNVSKRRGKDASKSVDVGGQTIKVLPFYDGTKYLGWKLPFDEYHCTEVNNWIAAAWRKFHMLRQELTNKKYALQSRLKLFDSAVTAAVLYGSEAWTLTKDLMLAL